MNIIFNIVITIVAVGFVGLTITSLVINIIRMKKAKEKMQTSPKYVSAFVKEIIKSKEVIMIVEFTSPTNKTQFTQKFTFSLKEFTQVLENGETKDLYEIDQEVQLAYQPVEKPDYSLKKQKKIHTFITGLKGDEVKNKQGAALTDTLMALVSSFFLYNILKSMIVEKGFTTDKPFSEIMSPDNANMGMFAIVVYIVVYVILLSYVMERVLSMTRDENYSYLKIYGIKTKARVVTFKLGGAKNARGYKESRMKIKYSTTTGEQIETNLNSYMYTETQEEYIDIIYDIRNFQNVVYLRK